MLTLRTRRNISLVLFIALLLVSAGVWSMNSAQDGPKDGKYFGKAQGFGGEVIVDVEISGGKIAAVQVRPHDETPFIAGPAIESLTKAIVAAQGVDVDVVAGATVTSKAVLAAAEQALQKASTTFKDGVYTGSAAGFNGPVKVEVTVSGGAIAAVKILEQDETPFIAKTALEKVPAAIVESQSWDVDGVSGATVTSEAIKAAVEEALTS